MPAKTVVIQTFGNEAEAEIARGFLNKAGIKSFVAKDDVGGMYPALQATGTGVSLKVQPKDATRAKKILQEIEKSDRWTKSHIASENLLALLSSLAWVLFPLGVSAILIGSTGQMILTYIGISLVVLGAVLETFLQLRKRKMGLSESPSKLSCFFVGLTIGVIVTGIVSWYLVGYSGTKQAQYDGVYKEDLNGDGKPDEWWTYRKGVLATVKVDKNFDGKPDEWCTYHKDSLATVEVDQNFDGKTDVWETYENEKISFAQADTDFNGVSDVTYFFVCGVLSSAEFRPNGGKTIVKKQVFKHSVLQEEWIDKDRDGKFDQKIIFDFLENPIMTIPFRKGED